MVRKVRTEAGSKRYGLPIGSPITARAVQAAAEKVAHGAAPTKAAGHKAASVRKLTTAEARRAEGAVSGFSGERFRSRGHAEAFSSLQSKRIHPDAVKEFSSIATALRAGHGHDRAEKIDAAMEPLDRDLVVTRHLPASAFGRRKPTDLVGKKIADKAYSPAALHEDESPEGGYTLHISAPAGTKAMVAGENEVWLDRDLPLAVQSVEPNDHGGYDVHVVALPKAQTTRKTKASGVAKAAAESPEVAPVPHAETPSAPSAEKAPVPAAVRGGDISDHVDYGALAKSLESASGNDPALGDIWRQQGFDGKPEVVSHADFDKRVAAGEVRDLWRGLVGQQADQYAEQFRTGDAHPGLGIYGNGTYVALTRSKAEMYAGPQGAILRIGLHKDAKVISAAELDAKMRKAIGSQRAEVDKRIKALDAQMLNEYDRAKTAEQRLAVIEKYRKLKEDAAGAQYIIQQDPGRFAALLGYDAIDVPATWRGSKDKVDQLVILNRTATIVQGA